MHHRPRRLLLALLSIANAGSPGCDRASGVTDADADRAPSVVVQRLPEAQSISSTGGMTTRQRLVIRDDAAWADAWKQMTSPFQPVPPAPKVDFTRNVIIVAAMGAKGTGGYSIAVEEVRIGARGAVVSVVEESPGSGCVTTQAVTTPVAVVVVPRFTQEVTFAEHASRSTCR